MSCHLVEHIFMRDLLDYLFPYTMEYVFNDLIFVPTTISLEYQCIQLPVEIVIRVEIDRVILPW